MSQAHAHPRPVIAVTGPDEGGTPAWLFTAAIVRWAGGTPLRLTPKRRERLCRPVHGIVLGGGADVSPETYAASAADESDTPVADSLASTNAPRRIESPRVPREDAPQAHSPTLPFRELKALLGTGQTIAGLALSPALWALRRVFSVKRHSGIDRERDDLELAVLKRATSEQLPVLGICRGAQLINVFQGGTLHQSLDAYIESPQPWTVLPQKRVTTSPHSELERLVGKACRVNSMHRQAIDKLGEDLHVSACDSSKIVQGVERRHPYWIGVQWHPEYLLQRQEQRRLFQALVERAQRKRQA